MSRFACVLLTPLVLTGCAPVLQASFSEGGIWDFYLFDDPDSAGDFIVLPEGTVTARDATGGSLSSAVTDRGDGLWRIDAEPDQVVDIVMTGPSHVRTVRRATTPTTTGQFSTPLHPRSLSIVPPLMDAIAAVDGLDVADSQSLLAGEAAAVVVQPLDPEAWMGAELSLVDGSGAGVELSLLTEVEAGSYSLSDGTPVDLVLATDVAPGVLTFTVRPTAGPEVVQLWFAAPGDLIDGRYFALAWGN